MSNRMMELRKELTVRKAGKRGTPRRRNDTPRETVQERLNDRERLTRMEQRGEIKLGTGKIPADFWSKPRPKDPEGEVLDALLDERQYGY